MFTTERGPESRPLSLSRDGLALALLFAATFIVHALSPVTTSTDSAWTFHVAASLLREGNADLDEYRPVMDLALDYRLREIGGHIYYYYPIGTPLLVAPAVSLVNAVYPLSHPADFYTYLATHPPDDRTARLEKVLASLFVALATAGMYGVARQSLRVRGSAAVALMFAFATSMWSTASRALWQHGPSVLLTVMALYIVVSKSRPAWSLIASGLVLGFAYVVRPTNSLPFIIFGLYYLLNEKRRIWLFALGGALILVPFAAQNWLTFGNLLPPYSYQLFERLGGPAVFGEALVGTLLSPNRGLFIFTPLFLFSIWGTYTAFRRGDPNPTQLTLFLAAIVFGHWITTSLFEDWGGAWSIGPRYFVDVIPYLVYFLIPVVASLGAWALTWRAVFLAAVAVSVAIQAHCAISRYPFMWNGKPQALVEAPQRKWDWGDMQFLRGFCPGAELEGRAPACWWKNDG
jgi:hypothetical protein